MSDSFFGEVKRAAFLRRPNRFIVECDLEGEPVRAYLPNPGRLWELFFPGVTLFLSTAPEGRRTAYTVVAVERDGLPVMLHTHMTNEVIHRLLTEGRIPGLEDAAVVRPEVKVGRHRFDFLLDRQGKPFYLEVKSCTLFEGAMAMFPDAVTDRGRRHLEELAALSRREGVACGVLIAVQWPRARWFLPDYHTDFAFAQTFLDVRHDLWLQALSLSWRDDLSLGDAVAPVSIPWSFLENELHDGGCYLLVLALTRETPLTIGSLGERIFPAGYYVYTGSAKKNLTQRIDRHCRKRKNFHWHIDTLRDAAASCTALAVRTTEDLEHELAQALRPIAQGETPNFGCSDCSCSSHLFYFAENPLRQRAFINLLQRFRMGRVEERLLSPAKA
ncbi:DNA/RNA nuclease SfsA [Heliobacterium gestii]|uniref:DNA/RNA nuclease SfsA n=1 Tax=Heliomicrobium gestii TaxID=2699 RepID=A0A845LMA8_HELGE|nr:DNA/RNA nuclease SfsA [Heliomicrobium gestii]MBM7867622.1 sugar fermentation stimulation protein A [Heliomicrobium gestii]MZP44016.1 DNA/RNA nuclease SfsA [Heliomicrobium gestii]